VGDRCMQLTGILGVQVLFGMVMVGGFPKGGAIHPHHQPPAHFPGRGSRSLQEAVRHRGWVQGTQGCHPGQTVPHDQRDDRICAHLFIAQLALLLLRELRHRLNEKDVPFSAKEALAAVKSTGVAELDLNGEKQVLVSGPKPHARRVLAALGISDPQPPGSSRKNTPSAARKKAM